MEEVALLFLKLAFTLVLTGILGVEREVTGHKAGMRTLILVGIGAASLVMLVERLDIPEQEIGRIIAGVATGIGFLGAGAIIKEGINVKGLTTAATIWVTASIGVSIGAGAYYIGFITFSFAIIVLTIFGIMERRFKLKPKNGILKFVVNRDSELPKKQLKRLQSKGIRIQRMRMEKNREGNLYIMDVELPRNLRIVDMIGTWEKTREISSVEWRDLELKTPSNYLEIFDN